MLLVHFRSGEGTLYIALIINVQDTFIDWRVLASYILQYLYYWTNKKAVCVYYSHPTVLRLSEKLYVIIKKSMW